MVGNSNFMRRLFMSKKKKKKNKVKLIPRNINTTTTGLFDWSELFRRRNNIMITAMEARKITEESRSMLQKTIDEVDYYIDDAIHEGKHMVMIDGFISKETVKALKLYGYAVMESDTRFQVVW